MYVQSLFSHVNVKSLSVFSENSVLGGGPECRICNIVTSLGANPGSIFNLHKCDV